VSCGRGAVAVLREALARFRAEDMADHAAALTYYALLSLFPALLVGMSLFGLLGESRAIDDVARYLSNHGGRPSMPSARRCGRPRRAGRGPGSDS